MKRLWLFKPVVWLTILLLPNIGCGLQHSFRRPKKEKKEKEARSLPRLGSTQSSYLRAFYSWSADHATLVERIEENPKVVWKVYKRLSGHLRGMHACMYRKESEVFEREVLKIYDSLMNPWPGRGSTTVIERRLKRLEARVRRDFRPGTFPLKRPGESVEEFED